MKENSIKGQTIESNSDEESNLEENSTKEQESIQKENISNQGICNGNSSKKGITKKTKIVVGIIVLLLMIGGTITGIHIRKKAVFEDYKNNFSLTLATINSETEKCIDITDKVSSTWHDAIFSDEDIDFNIALLALYIDYNDKGIIDEIKDGKEGIDVKITELQDTPEEFKYLYDEILELYSIYSQVEKQAESPNGSLQSFNEEMNSLENDCTKLYNKIKIRIPSKMGN